MLFLWFAFALQTGVLLELSLNRIVGIFLNTKRSSSRTLVDANFVSQIVNLLVSILLVPLTWIDVCVQVLLSQFSVLLSLLAVVGVMAVINQSSSNRAHTHLSWFWRLTRMSTYNIPCLCHIKKQKRRRNVKVLVPEAFSSVAWLKLCDRKRLIDRCVHWHSNI